MVGSGKLGIAGQRHIIQHLPTTPAAEHRHAFRHGVRIRQRLADLLDLPWKIQRRALPNQKFGMDMILHAHIRTQHPEPPLHLPRPGDHERRGKGGGLRRDVIEADDSALAQGRQARLKLGRLRHPLHQGMVLHPHHSSGLGGCGAF